MEIFTKVTGAAVPLLSDDINTDQIIPSAFLKDINADLKSGFMAYLRRRPDGGINENFVLERPQYKKAPILITGDNFGCGSSREHAVWAMRAFGVRCVIGHSPAELFRENCLKNGVLPVVLDKHHMLRLSTQVIRADGQLPFTVDLESCRITGPDFDCGFEISAHERTALLEGLDDIGLTLKHLIAIQQWEVRTASERPFMQASIASLAFSG